MRYQYYITVLILSNNIIYMCQVQLVPPPLPPGMVYTPPPPLWVWGGVGVV